MDRSVSKPGIGRAAATSAALGVLMATAGMIQPVAAAAAPKVNPSVPSELKTVPATDCQGNTVIGDGDVTLYAAVSAPEGGTLGADFQVTRSGDDNAVVAEADPAKLTVPSGTAAVYRIPRATLEAAAAGAITEFDWKVRAADAGDLSNKSHWSTTCHFSFDPTRPGAPTIALPGTSVIGKPARITISGPTSGTVPSGYQYQLNSGAPVNVTADASGNAAITVIPASAVTTVSVTSVSAGGNFGGAVNATLLSAAPPPDLTDGDLTGEGVPDLLVVGGKYGLPSGLWLAPGAGNGQVATSPTDIGTYGSGFNTNGGPSDFDGATVIAGRFSAGPNQDVLVYYPTGLHAGVGLVVAGNGTGAPLGPTSSRFTVMSGTFQDFNGNNPTQLVNAGSVSGGTTGYPDLMGILGDSTNGYGLTLYQSGWAPASYPGPVTLNVNTPDGTADWNNWTIATTQLPASGGGTSTAMFLWKKSTGELDLWENLAADPNTGSLSYNAYPVATNWNTGADVALQAADINSDGVPDLWTVGAGETATANLFGNLSSTGPATLTQVTTTLNATP